MTRAAHGEDESAGDACIFCELRGRNADLVVFRPDDPWTVARASLEGRLVTPYLGRKLYGIVERTYLRGARIFEHGGPFPAPRGRLITTFM